DAVGGFAPDRGSEGIEDVELGYRLRAAGHRIRLDRGILVTHLKRWTLRSVVWTDGMRRALPWSRLLVAGRLPLDHLNVDARQRWSAAAAAVAVVALPLAAAAPSLRLVPVVAGAAVLALNRDLLAFFARERGVAFATATVPLLFLHYLESGACYAWVWVAH